MNTKDPKVVDKASRMADAQCQKAVQYLNKQKYKEALDGFDSVLKKIPGHRLAQRRKPTALFLMGRYTESARLFHELHKQDPDDLIIIKQCGIAYNATGEFDVAIQFLSRYVQFKPEDFDAWTTLAAAAGKSKKYVDAMMYATKALSLDPKNPDAFNNLGATLLGVNRADEAEKAFETALALDKKNLDALSNLATLAQQRGDYKKANALFGTVLNQVDLNTPFGKGILYRSSFPLLAIGQLREGWRRYDFGFSPTDLSSRTPKRKFVVPQWRGEPLEGKRLLIWGEQGIGDELWFYGLLNEARLLCDNIVVECEPRLVSLIKRSFPDMEVRSSNLNPIGINEKEDFDLHIPAGSLMAVFCNEIEDLKKFKPYIKPDSVLVEKFSARLQQFKGKKLVGICWRSGRLDANRNKHYLNISELYKVLKLDNCIFINLQYGECASELMRVEEELGVFIQRWSDVDLKNNQEQVAALISCLDAVVTAGTAVSALAMSVGVETLLFGPRGWDFLGQEEYPYSSCVKSFCPEDGSELSDIIPKIVSCIQEICSDN